MIAVIPPRRSAGDLNLLYFSSKMIEYVQFFWPFSSGCLPRFRDFQREAFEKWQIFKSQSDSPLQRRSLLTVFLTCWLFWQHIFVFSHLVGVVSGWRGALTPPTNCIPPPPIQWCLCTPHHQQVHAGHRVFTIMPFWSAECQELPTSTIYLSVSEIKTNSLKVPHLKNKENTLSNVYSLNGFLG